jgi:hypothetical protein
MSLDLLGDAGLRFGCDWLSLDSVITAEVGRRSLPLAKYGDIIGSFGRGCWFGKRMETDLSEAGSLLQAILEE